MAQGQSGRVEGSLAVGIQAGPALSLTLQGSQTAPHWRLDPEDGWGRQEIPLYLLFPKPHSLFPGRTGLVGYLYYLLCTARGPGGAWWGPGGPAGTRPRAGPLSVAAPQLSLSTTL